MGEKVQYDIEFPVKASPSMLYPFLSTPSGLSEWFCDDVNSRGERFTFFWDGAEETARLLSKKTNHYIRFQWEEDEEVGNKCFFEFRIVVDELTNDTSLIVTDYAEEDEIHENKLLWESQIGRMLRIIGS